MHNKYRLLETLRLPLETLRPGEGSCLRDHWMQCITNNNERKTISNIHLIIKKNN